MTLTVPARTRRLAAAAVPALVLLLAAAGPATAGTVTHGPGHGGGAAPAAPVPADGATPTATHTAARIDLPRSATTFENPAPLAAAALVQLRTTAHVYVALHKVNLFNYDYDLEDPRAIATGAYVNGRSTALSSFGALHRNPEQIQRFRVAAVNRAFTDHRLLPPQPDVFARTRIADPKTDVYLQSCYDATAPVQHCSIFMEFQTRVFPSVADASLTKTGVPAITHNDPQVSAFVTSQETTPVALQISNPQAGEKYWIVTSQGVNKDPKVTEGTFTDEERPTIAAAELKRLYDDLGPAGDGSPIVTSSGDLVAIIGLQPGAAAFEMVDGSHLVNDVRNKFQLRRDGSATDSDFRDGLLLLENREYRSALKKLQDTANATGGQHAVLGLVGLATEKQGTAEDVSDEAAIPFIGGDDGGSAGTILWVTLLLVLLVALAAGGLLLARRRRAGRPGPEPDPMPGPPAPAAPAPVAAAVAAPAVNGADRPPVNGSAPAAAAAPAGRPTGETETRSRPAVVGAGPAGERRAGPTTVFATGPAHDHEPPPKPAASDGGFCRSCGTQLSPGDRFCYSCGTPAARS